MPIREYITTNPENCCDHCRAGFECVEAIEAEPLETCPRCGGKIERQLSAPRVGRSAAGLDDRAKNAGFTKLKKLGDGEYEQKY